MLINNNIGFIHVPKTGGQSIENVLMQVYGVTRETALLCRNRDKKLGPPRLAHLSQREYQQIYNYQPHLFFGLLRNPETRFLSEVNFRSYTQEQAEIFLNKIQLSMVENDYKTGEDYHRHIMPQVDFFDFQQSASKISIFKYEEFFKNPHEHLRTIGIYYNGEMPHKRPKASKRREQEGVVLTSIMKQKLQVCYKRDYDYYETVFQV